MRGDAKEESKGLCSSFGTGLILLGIVYPFSLAYQLIQEKPFSEASLPWWLGFLIPGGLLALFCLSLGFLAFAKRGNEKAKKVLTLLGMVIAGIETLGGIPQWFAFHHAEFAISTAAIALCVGVISLLYRYDNNEVSK